MNSKFCLVVVSVILSCGSIEQFSTVRFERESSSGSSTKTVEQYTMLVPKEHKLETLVGGHRELEKRYIYSDSAILYISDFAQSMANYSNITSLGDSVANNRYEPIKLRADVSNQLGEPYEPKKIILSGRSTNGLYWKDVRVGYLSIGYVNVQESRKIHFEKALRSFLKR